MFALCRGLGGWLIAGRDNSHRFFVVAGLIDGFCLVFFLRDRRSRLYGFNFFICTATDADRYFIVYFIGFVGVEVGSAAAEFVGVCRADLQHASA